MSKCNGVKCSWIDSNFFHYNKLSSIFIAETTFSSPDNLIILTPCVFLPAVLISLTATLITLPLLVDINISSPSKTGNEDAIFPFLDELTMPIMPFPPLLVVRNSLSFVLFPNPFSVIKGYICLQLCHFCLFFCQFFLLLIKIQFYLFHPNLFL